MPNKKPLWEDVIKFSKDKYIIALVLIIVGVLGLLLPIIPGVLLIALGILILKPEWYEKVKKKFTESLPWILILILGFIGTKNFP